MNFIENLFGMSPDGGSGLLELLLMLFLLFAAFFGRRSLSERRSHGSRT